MEWMNVFTLSTRNKYKATVTKNVISIYEHQLIPIPAINQVIFTNWATVKLKVKGCLKAKVILALIVRVALFITKLLVAFQLKCNI